MALYMCITPRRSVIHCMNKNEMLVLIAYARKSLLNVHVDVFSGARGLIIGLKILKF